MSRSQRPRKAYRPRHSACPLAYLTAFQGAMRLGRSDQARLALELSMAVDNIVRGAGEVQHDWRTVFDIINLLDAFSSMPSVLRDATDYVEGLQALMVQIFERQRASGTRALYAQEIAALRELVAAWTQLLDTVTHSELFKARERVQRTVARVLRGDVKPGERVVEAA